MISQSTVLENLLMVQQGINELFSHQKGYKYFIRPCWFFEMLTSPSARNFKVVVHPGQTGKNIKVTIIDGLTQFDETIDARQNFQIDFMCVPEKIIPLTLEGMTKIEGRLNSFLSKQKVNASKKYYLLLYVSNSLPLPVIQGNCYSSWLVSPQMGLPFNFILKDEVPNPEITLTLTYKLGSH